MGTLIQQEAASDQGGFFVFCLLALHHKISNSGNTFILSKQNMIARHGDVILVPVDSVEGELVKHSGSFPLAFGEVTGHSHQLRVKNPENMRVFQLGPKLYVQLLEVGTLTHEEHKQIEIQPGTYRRDMEREYDYAMESFRTVID